jgi:hypothetical protein
MFLFGCGASHTSEHPTKGNSINAKNEIVSPSPSGNVIRAESFGAVGDGIKDDTDAFQSAIDYLEKLHGGTVMVPKGTFMINSEKSVFIKSNIKLHLDSNAVIESLPTASGNYSVLTISHADHVSISGGEIRGDRNRHLGKSNEDYGRDINIEGSHDVTITNLTASNSWGDGIYVGDNNNSVNNSDILIQNVVCNNNRRNGMSIISGENIFVKDVIAENSNGASPKAGIDVEPNNTKDELKSINLENITTRNNNQGLQIGLVGMRQSTTPLDVHIRNHQDFGSAIGLFISTPERSGLVEITGSHWENNKIQQVRQLNRSPYIDDTFSSAHVDVIFKKNNNDEPLNIVSDQLPDAIVNKPYSFRLSHSGGLKPYLWGINQPLPEGLNLTPNGYLKGMLAIPGTYRINVIISDNEYNRRSKLLTLNVKDGIK